MSPETPLLTIDRSLKARLKERVVLVTGGCAGIGLAAVRSFHEVGCNVVVGDLGPPPACEALFSSSRTIYRRTDVTKYAEQLALFRAAETKWGVWPDIVLVNAGIGEKGDALLEWSDDVDQEPDHKTVLVDLVAAAMTVRLAMYGMRKNGRGGSIVLTASMAGYMGQPGLPMYNAAKHGLIGLMRSLRYTAPRAEIAVSLVAPAITATTLVGSDAQPTEGGTLSLVPALRAAGVPLNTPEDVADVSVYLAALGPKANGYGVMVQGGKAANVEAGVMRARKLWMGGEMDREYRKGKDEGVFDKGEQNKKESKL